MGATMAIARCEKCGRPEARKPPAYVDAPRTPFPGLVCGTKGCENDAMVWLKEDEEAAYLRGQRVFDIRTDSAKIRLP
jgi:hypothetical protein